MSENPIYSTKPTPSADNRKARRKGMTMQPLDRAGKWRLWRQSHKGPRMLARKVFAAIASLVIIAACNKAAPSDATSASSVDTSTASVATSPAQATAVVAPSNSTPVQAADAPSAVTP